MKLLYLLQQQSKINRFQFAQKNCSTLMTPLRRPDVSINRELPRVGNLRLGNTVMDL